ncbi:MAG: heavy-metal-associated domain-containing protein [Peptococcaceae bacterium]|nr:cation transporter [Peptococcaceae bacterium]MDH7525047.1 heavy-metal-associated domain-containing protein [Peptococcaceae bacterium]
MAGVILSIDGMSSDYCKIAVEKALGGLGVDVDVNLAEKTVSIEYDPSRVELGQIIGAIEGQGYRVL